MHYQPVQILWFVFTLLLLGCRGEQTGADNSKAEISQLSMDVLLEIGLPSQPVEHQLGEPFSVVTDENDHIYIADESDQSIKIFDRQGKYLKSIGGRGRGPGEFMNMSIMTTAGKDTLLIQDRGKLEFIYLKTDGEFISSHPVDLTSQQTQYYPESIEWFTKMGEKYSIGIQQDAAFPRFDPPPVERPLFYIYDLSFSDRISSFFSFNELGYTEREMFIWSSFIYYEGSFDYSSKLNQFVYSPGVYRGNLYVFGNDSELGWNVNKRITGFELNIDSFKIYNSEQEYEEKRHIPGVNKIRYSGVPYWGRIYAVDAGVYYLSDGRIIHFYGIWTEGEKTLEDGNPLKLFAQIFSDRGQILQHGYLMDIHTDRKPSVTLVNWKDDQDNFYLLNVPKDDVPTVNKFRLELEELADSGQ